MKITPEQSHAIQIKMQETFNSWKDGILQTRDRHIATILSSQEFSTIKLRQTAVATIDRDIKEGQLWIDEMIRVVKSFEEKEQTAPTLERTDSDLVDWTPKF